MKLSIASAFYATLVLAPWSTTPVNAAEYNGDCGGCKSCTAEVLERKSDGMSIGQHIAWGLGEEMTEDEACKSVCGEKFSAVCGEECDPDQCEKYNSFISTSDLKAAVNAYCNNPQEWESNDLFNKYGPIENWDTSEIEDMGGLFFYEETCNPDISKWNVSKVKSFSGMFYHAEAFNQDIGGWDVSSGTNFYGMFYYAEAFNQDIGGWDVSSGTNFSDMFLGTKAFNQDIGGWDISSGTNFHGMFYHAEAFNQDICGHDEVFTQDCDDDIAEGVNDDIAEGVNDDIAEGVNDDTGGSSIGFRNNPKKQILKQLFCCKKV